MRLDQQDAAAPPGARRAALAIPAEDAAATAAAAAASPSHSFVCTDAKMAQTGERRTLSQTVPSGAERASGGTETVVLILETSSGRVVHRLEGHRNTIYGLAWSPDASQLATAAFDRTARVWKIA